MSDGEQQAVGELTHELPQLRSAAQAFGAPQADVRPPTVPWALTEIRFRDRNAYYLRELFGDSDNYCILIGVPMVNDATPTPDWDDGNSSTLFEWQR